MIWRYTAHRLFFFLAFYILCSSIASAQTKMSIAYSSLGAMATGVWMAKGYRSL